MMKKNTEAGDDMTQKERILNAKHCLDALALGLDPATGAELPDDSVLNRVELSRCFFFVSGLLQELHERRTGARPAVCPAGRAARAVPVFGAADAYQRDLPHPQ